MGQEDEVWRGYHMHPRELYFNEESCMNKMQQKLFFFLASEHEAPKWVRVTHIIIIDEHLRRRQTAREEKQRSGNTGRGESSAARSLGVTFI